MEWFNNLGGWRKNTVGLICWFFGGWLVTFICCSVLVWACEGYFDFEEALLISSAWPAFFIIQLIVLPAFVIALSAGEAGFAFDREHCTIKK